MAGSFSHCTDKETGKFQGLKLLDGEKDCHEALHMMHAMIYILSGGDRGKIEQAENLYYEWCRGEVEIPEWPGVQED